MGAPIANQNATLVRGGRSARFVRSPLLHFLVLGALLLAGQRWLLPEPDPPRAPIVLTEESSERDIDGFIGSACLQGRRALSKRVVIVQPSREFVAGDAPLHVGSDHLCCGSQ